MRAESRGLTNDGGTAGTARIWEIEVSWGIQGRAVPAPALTLAYLFRKYSRAVLETLRT